MRTSDVHNTGSEALTSSENEDIAYCMWPVRLARLQRWVSRLMGEIHSQRDIGVIKEETFDNIYSALLESHMTGLMYEMQPEHCDDPQNRAFIVDVEQEVELLSIELGCAVIDGGGMEPQGKVPYRPAV